MVLLWQLANVLPFMARYMKEVAAVLPPFPVNIQVFGKRRHNKWPAPSHALFCPTRPQSLETTNPDSEADCWCKKLYRLYGPICFVDVTSTPTSSLAFKKAVPWFVAELCQLNYGRSLGDVNGFRGGRRTLTEQKQTLSVFHFDGQGPRGCDKLSWDELGNEETRVLKAGGLGASQKAEVASHILTNWDCPMWSITLQNSRDLLKNGAWFQFRLDSIHFQREWPNGPANL